MPILPNGCFSFVEYSLYVNSVVLTYAKCADNMQMFAWMHCLAPTYDWICLSITYLSKYVLFLK